MAAALVRAARRCRVTRADAGAQQHGGFGLITHAAAMVMRAQAAMRARRSLASPPERPLGGGHQPAA